MAAVDADTDLHFGSCDSGVGRATNAGAPSRGDAVACAGNRSWTDAAFVPHPTATLRSGRTNRSAIDGLDGSGDGPDLWTGIMPWLAERIERTLFPPG